MEARQIQHDLRALVVMILGLFPKTDERYQLAHQIASRYGMVELLDDRMGSYEGGDG